MLRKFLFLFTLLVHGIVLGQHSFFIREDGLTPTSIVLAEGSVSSQELYNQTSHWIRKNSKKYRLAVVEEIEPQHILITSIKGNAVNLGDRYFHAKYAIQISFSNNQCTFQPTDIWLKVNSKYDMGWEEFDLGNATSFHKKGKVIKKYRAYLRDLTSQLNTIFAEYRSFMDGL